MATRIGGNRRKTRHKMTKPRRAKGKISISAYFRQFADGEKVILSVEPAVQKGFYPPKFMGKTGVVQKKVGTCYEIAIKDFNKPKTVIVHPVHLKKV